MAAVGDLVKVHEDIYGDIGPWEGLFFSCAEDVFRSGLTYGDRCQEKDIYLVLERARHYRKKNPFMKSEVKHAIRVLNLRDQREYWTSPGNMVVLTRAQGRKK